MRKLLISLFACLGIFFSISAAADVNMAPPAPVNNPTYEAMVGKWQADHEMMGMKMHDEVNIHWALNHQFLVMELEATNTADSKMKFNGIGIMGVDSKGKAKVWWFDSWGADAMSTGTGEFKDNKLILHSSNPMSKEVRTFEVKGNEMTMNAKGTMKWQGKETAYDETAIYHKK